MRLRSLFVCLFIVVTSTISAEDEPSIYGTRKADQIFQTKGLAIRGYDPVAYFIQKKPVKGKKEFEYRYEGANWLFASAENRDLFARETKKICSAVRRLLCLWNEPRLCCAN